MRQGSPRSAEPAVEHFRRAFREGPSMLLLLGPPPDYVVLEASEAFLRNTGRTRAELIGRTIFDILLTDAHPTHEEALARLRTSLERMRATRQPDTVHGQQFDMPSESGTGFDVHYWSSTNAPIYDENGELVCVVHRVEDTTELVHSRSKEQAERAALALANKRFQAIYDQGLFAGRLNLAGNVVDVNHTALVKCGFTRDEVIGKPFWECGWWNRSPDVQTWVRSAVQRAVGGEPVRGETTYFLADGTPRVVEFACMPIKDEDGKVLFVVPTGIDVTERVAAERDYHATEILESITEGFYGFDRDWRFTYVNRAAENIVGGKAQDLLGRVLWDVHPKLIGSAFESVYRRVMTEREASSITAFYPDHQRWYDVHAYPAAGGGISMYFRDVSEQKRIEDEREHLAAQAEHQRRMYEAALANTPDLVFVWDLQHRFVYANEALVEVWGRTRDDVLGKSCLELGYEPWHAEMHDREIDRVIATRMPIRGEVPYTGTGGRRIYEYIFVPVLGPRGDVVAVAGTARDITERQHNERAIREQAERLRALDRAKDEFLATLSHELRNPLAPLRNSLALLRMATPKDSTAAPIHDMMERQVNHLVRLVDDLLETSRLTRGTLMLKRQAVEVATFLQNAIETSRPVIDAAGHRLEVTLPKEPLWVDGDPVRLAQIVGNLLDNAAKYTPHGGAIAVTARRDGDTVAIAVRDTGVGLNPDTLPHVFEMFNRGERYDHTHEGLGIGLALARRLAQLHGGTLDARSEGVGFGSEFTLRLPLAKLEERPAPAAPEAESAFAHQRILVVDDNEDAAQSLGMMLELLGSDVRVAHGGHEALEVFPQYEPAVVLLDIGMPDMDGYEVARTLRRRFPDSHAAIVALTGWGQENDRRRAREAGFDYHLIKPAEISTLQQLLASLAR